MSHPPPAQTGDLIWPDATTANDITLNIGATTKDRATILGLTNMPSGSSTLRRHYRRTA